MAPEQEPLSALYWNVRRSELSMAAELEAAAQQTAQELTYQHRPTGVRP